MSPREEFPTKGLEDAPSNDIGWHFGTPVPNAKGNIVCKLCGKVVKGGITRFKEHIGHKTGNVAPCPNVTEGRSSYGSSIPTESEFTLRGAIPELVRSKSSKQPKLPTPYEVSDVYLESEYQRVRHWVNRLKTYWKELGATLMCDDISSVPSRDAEFYYSLLDSVVEEIGENYIVQIVTDNEAAMKAAGKKLILKRKHLYWTSCAAHCLDLCLKDIGKRPSVANLLDEAKKVTCFIYNHTWTVDLMKKYTQGKQILRPALTRFATHFIQLEEITRQKQGLREMFNSKEYKESKWGQQKSGPTYEAKKIVLGKDF
ncbi:hypothetical protein CXB51_019599 [Gossypium anomalum]|uniref:BED-type domain-containing protein n=1 Tax=Gossypium anomalum TaxID=47600 RepID=A0A8J5YL36_9ROSI|nr:hypothetical protein CXB51_019599 [Gossypium anomalum]